MPQIQKIQLFLNFSPPPYDHESEGFSKTALNYTHSKEGKISRPSKRIDFFGMARSVSAQDAAQRIGLRLTSKSDKLWSCCPNHADDTPSLCLYPDGHFYCFSCHKYGRATELYSLQYGISAREAAIAVCRDFSLSEEDKESEANRKRKSSEWEHIRSLDAAKGREWTLLCNVKHAANSLLSTYSDPNEDIWSDPAFVFALKAREQVEYNLDILQHLNKEALEERYNTNRPSEDIR